MLYLDTDVNLVVALMDLAARAELLLAKMTQAQACGDTATAEALEKEVLLLTLEHQALQEPKVMQ